MAEQRNETVTPKTATVEPVEVTVAVRSNQAFTDLETAHVVSCAGVGSHAQYEKSIAVDIKCLLLKTAYKL